MSAALPLPDAVRGFLAPPRFAVLATLDPGGAPRQAVAWYLPEPDGTLVVNSAVGRRWPANLRRDARVSVAVVDGGGYSWVGLTGRVIEVIDDQEQAQADIAAMARRYHADDAALAERMIERTFRAQRRVSFRIAISAVHDHLEE